MARPLSFVYALRIQMHKNFLKYVRRFVELDYQIFYNGKVNEI